MSNSAIFRNDQIVNVFFLGSVLIVTNVLDAVGLVNTYSYLLLNLAILVYVCFISWLASDKGNHPAFLFIVLLLVFQCGRLFVALFFNVEKAFVVDLQVDESDIFFLSVDTVKKSVLLISLSAIAVNFSAFLVRNNSFAGIKKISSGILKENELKQQLFFRYLYWITLPFSLIKVLLYLKYVLSHGGYLAIYTSGDEMLSQVGFAIRGISAVNQLAFVGCLFLEEDLKRLRIIIFSFFIVLLVELFVGLRGKFFVYGIVILMIYNIKTDKKISFSKALVVSGVVVVVSLFIAYFRENKSQLEMGLMSFFNSQGVSFLVTGLAVEKYDLFQVNSLNYLLNQLLLPYVHVSSFKAGELFANDLSAYLNPLAFESGYATGTSYLADLYLVGKMPAVFFASIFLGGGSNYFFKKRNIWFNIAEFNFLLSFVYLPRSGFFEPIANVLKIIPLLVFCYLLYRFLCCYCISARAKT